MSLLLSVASADLRPAVMFHRGTAAHSSSPPVELWVAAFVRIRSVISVASVASVVTLTSLTIIASTAQSCRPSEPRRRPRCLLCPGVGGGAPSGGKGRLRHWSHPSALGPVLRGAVSQRSRHLRCAELEDTARLLSKWRVLLFAEFEELAEAGLVGLELSIDTADESTRAAQRRRLQHRHPDVLGDRKRRRSPEDGAEHGVASGALLAVADEGALGFGRLEPCRTHPVLQHLEHLRRLAVCNRFLLLHGEPS